MFVLPCAVLYPLGFEHCRLHACWTTVYGALLGGIWTNAIVQLSDLQTQGIVELISDAFNLRRLDLALAMLSYSHLLPHEQFDV